MFTEYELVAFSKILYVDTEYIKFLRLTETLDITLRFIPVLL